MRFLPMTIFFTLALYQCTRDVTAAPYSFKCPGVGVYPDPADCHSFYTCDSSLVPNPGTCMDGKGTFDPENQVCTTAACSGSGTFVCPSSGFFADPDDCHGFYVCDENLNSTQGTCTKYASFDPTSICVLGSCVQSSSTTTTAAPNLNPPFKCTEKGYFADPKDCHSYYICDGSLTASHRICMGGAGHFDPDTAGCLYEAC